MPVTVNDQGQGKVQGLLWQLGKSGKRNWQVAKQEEVQRCDLKVPGSKPSSQAGATSEQALASSGS